jgi:hypothetical protein
MGFRSKTISLLFRANGKDSLAKALKGSAGIGKRRWMADTLFLFFRPGVNEDYAAIPASGDGGGAHYLIRRKALPISLIVESAEPRESSFSPSFWLWADAKSYVLTVV